MANAFRGLTEAEVALAETVFPDPLPYDRIRLREGAGGNAIAALAFAAGNGAITLRNSIYFASGLSADFATAGIAAQDLFLHELTHVWQYSRSGVVPFLGRYGFNLASVGFRPRRAYDYGPGQPFAGARLEAQAAMVGHYHRARKEGNAALIRLLEGNLKDSGFFGL